MSILRKFTLALSYVTTCPFLRKPSSDAEIAGLACYLPAAGLVVGGVLLLCWRSLLFVGAPPAVLATGSVIAWIAFTGGIHLDGLMDAADGILSHRSRDRMLEIMQDSRTGTFGAVSGMLLILSKFSGLISVQTELVGWALLVIPAWARWAEVIAIGCYPYAREQGMGKIWHESTAVPGDLFKALAVPLIATVLLCTFGCCWQLLVIACSATVFSGILASIYMNSQIQGQTGDTYGAVVEIAEAVGIMAFAAAVSAAPSLTATPL
ncbi:MAG: adenosylcobinamide-GDP ribazoletransferase [Candidatus Obscuribacterales bacterium]|nr:adenosylcobinamide-GDP ribazoletransferase [Candidatus Obscuribacterales bacterium]